MINFTFYYMGSFCAICAVCPLRHLLPYLIHCKTVSFSLLLVVLFYSLILCNFEFQVLYVILKKIYNTMLYNIKIFILIKMCTEKKILSIMYGERQKVEGQNCC